VLLEETTFYGFRILILAMLLQELSFIPFKNQPCFCKKKTFLEFSNQPGFFKK
jgi:hypothetical protein